jgi:hypothetical protein
VTPSGLHNSATGVALSRSISSHRDLENIPAFKLDVLRWLNGTRETVRQLAPSWAADKKHCRDVKYLTAGTSLEEAFRSALIANSTTSEEKMPASECASYFDLWLRDYEENPRARTGASKSAAEAEKAHHFNVACFSATAGKRLFTTANGYLGTTSPETRISDLVVVVLGGVTPFIVRENENERSPLGQGEEPNGNGTYTLVGDAYVHGLMKRLDRFLSLSDMPI